MRKLFFLLIPLLWFEAVLAQDPHFSQYNNSRGHINPAFVGTDSGWVITTNCRVQWPKFSDNYKSLNHSADRYFRKLRSGIGLNYVYDNAANGAFTTTRLDLNIAPHFELFKHKLVIQPGFQISLQQKIIDWSKLTFGDMIDERRGFEYNSNDYRGQSKKTILDFSAGLLLYTRTFYAGFAAHHLTQPNEGLYGPSKLPMRYTFQMGANIYFSDEESRGLILSPSIICMKQQNFELLLPGIAARYKWISLGFSYRNEDAFITTIAFHNRFLRVGYSYDYTTSPLTNATGGAHEVGISFYFRRHKQDFEIRTLRLI